MWANRFRTRFDDHFQQGAGPKSPGDITFLEDWVIDMCSWYGHLHVTIEGWRQLELHDPQIDELLTSPNVEQLRRLRNAVWHYQKDWVDNRILAFMQQPDVVIWVRGLNQHLGRFFLTWHQKRGLGESPGEADGVTVQ